MGKEKQDFGDRKTCDRDKAMKMVLGSVVRTVVTPVGKWVREGRTRTARSVDLKNYTSKDYVFSHCTIVAGLEVESNGYRIKVPYNDLVNTNGNGRRIS